MSRNEASSARSAARRRRLARRRATSTVAGLAAASLAALGVYAPTPALAVVGEESHADAVFLDGALLGGDLDSVAGIEGAHADYVDATEGPASDVDDPGLDVEALSLLTLGLPNEVLVGDVLDLGVVEQYAEAFPGGASTANTGTTGLGLDLLPLTDVPVIGGDALLATANVGLGAVGSEATLAEDGTLTRTTEIAAATANLQSPLVAGLTGDVDAAVTAVDTAVNGLEDDLQTALGGAVEDVVALVPGVGGVIDPTTTVTVDSRLGAAVSDLLDDTLSTDLITITPSTGAITVNLAGGIDLNDIPANSTLLSPALLQAISEDVAELLGELQTDVTGLLNNALDYIDLTVDSDLAIPSPLGGTLAGLTIDYTGTVQDLLAADADLEIAGTGLLAPLPLGLATGIVQDALGAVIQPVLNTAVATAGTALDTAVTGLTDGLADVLDLLAEVVQINLNVQNTGVDGIGETASVTAVQVVLLPGTDALTLDLATSSVGPNVQLAFTPTVAATDAETGGSTTATGDGWPVTNRVSLQVTDPAGDAVGDPIVVTTDADGAIPADTTYPIPGTAAEGTYTITATALNPDGTPTDIVATDEFEVTDVTAPDAPVILTPADGSSTNDTTPAVTGTGEPGALVDVEIDGAPVADDVLVAEDGTWSTPVVDPLAEGDHTVTATQTDAAGNESDPASNDFTVDTTAPAPPVITSPADGDVVADATPAITGTGEPGATVELVIDGTPVAADEPIVVDEEGVWSYTPAEPLDEGEHTVTATQTDAAGNESGPSEPVAFVIDTVAPAAPVIETPADGSSIADATPTVTGTGEPGALVDVSIDGAPIANDVLVDEGGTWSAPVTEPLAEGDHTVTAAQTDAAGNVSEPTTNAFAVDTTPPTVEITSPSDGEAVNDPTPPITGTGEPGSTVTVIIDDEPVGDVVVGEDGTWTFTPTEPLADGDHTVEAAAIDEAGNTATDGPIAFAVDTAAPDAPVITTPDDGAAIGDPTPEIAGTGEPGTTITVIVDGEPVGETEVGEDGTWTFTPAEPLEDGEHTITATATDDAGNVSEPSAPVTITVYTPTVAAPAAAFPGDEFDAAGSGWPANAEVTVQLTDADGDPVGDPVTVTTDGEGGLTAPIAVPDDATAGEYAVVATTGGGIRALAAFGVYTPRTAAAGPGYAGSDLPVTSEGWPPSTEVTVQLTDADGDPVGDPVTVTMTPEGTLPAGTAVAIPADAAPGDYTVTVTDADGHVSAASVAVYAPEVDAGESVDAGEELPVTGGGFPPNTELEVEVIGPGGDVIAGPITVVTDDSGDFATGIRIPGWAASGEYTLVVTAPDGTQFTDTFTVVGSALAATGAVMAPILPAAILLIGAGAALMLVRRRQLQA
ncbi:Ig-like domain-containing protein [Microbacterium sp. NPDC096154]|uniref:Ig-like domain-containing protein n=1 Tax=Microbacterium sp. NPDC096154 TaxID=3155549 RepID=UPI0033334C9B